MTARAYWILPGGAPGELGYCERCGEGLSISLPQPIYIVTAAMKAFVKHHSKCQPGKYFRKPPKTPAEWAEGRDTGSSSLTIYAAITGRSIDGRYDIPHDPDDFGRCYRLLELFPSWRKHLGKTIEICPQWKPFVEAWGELTALYDVAGWGMDGKRKSDGGRMYSRMKELEAAARRIQMA